MWVFALTSQSLELDYWWHEGRHLVSDGFASRHTHQFKEELLPMCCAHKHNRRPAVIADKVGNRVTSQASKRTRTVHIDLNLPGTKNSIPGGPANTSSLFILFCDICA